MFIHKSLGRSLRLAVMTLVAMTLSLSVWAQNISVTGTVTDVNGEEKKLYCFLMILGYSRMRYIEFVTDMSTQTLIKCHLNAFDYFGGYPEEILYDNMKQVVVKRLLKQKDST